MTNGEIETIRNIIARLKEPNCGCHNRTFGPDTDGLEDAIKRVNDAKINAVSDIYVQTWLITPLEMLLPESRDVDTAVHMSRK